MIEEDIKPIVEVTPKMVNAADDIVAQEVLIDETQVSDLRDYVTKADEEGKTTYMLRFSLSEYNAATVEYHDGGVHLSFPEFYAATDTVYLSFDIIYLGFVKNDVVTIIPVVADQRYPVVGVCDPCGRGVGRAARIAADPLQVVQSSVVDHDHTYRRRGGIGYILYPNVGGMDCIAVRSVFGLAAVFVTEI